MKKIKRYFAYLLVFAMILGTIPAVKAQETSETASSDSDIASCVTTIEVISKTTPVTRATGYTQITASKTTTNKNSKGEKLWSVSITATFQYNGTSVGCLSAKVSSTVYDNNWKVSGERKSVSISCSKNGTIS